MVVASDYDVVTPRSDESGATSASPIFSRNGCQRRSLWRLRSSGDTFITLTPGSRCTYARSSHYSYDLDTEAILRALRGVLGLANASVEDPAAAVTALQLCEQGLEFADALHLASSAPAGRFVTFDERLVKRAARVAPGRVGLA